MTPLIYSLTRPRTSVIPWIQMGFTLMVFTFAFAYEAHWWWLTVAAYFMTGCLGVTITFHRYLTHRSFRMPKAAEYLFSFFASMGGTGSSIGWVAVHRQHHRYADTAKDPHSPVSTGWRVLFGTYRLDFNKWQVRDLITDRFHALLHNYYYVWFALWGALLLAIDFRVFLFGFIAPVAFQLWISYISNFFNHYSGYRNFETHENSTNSIPLAMLTWGEGWHNNHHRYPTRWNFQVKWWEFDVSSWVIRAFPWKTAKSPKRIDL